MKKWFVVLILGAAQFVMVLDGTVMNVSISAVVDDLDSSVTAMQSAITFYTLTMAATMLLGAKLGDIWGRRRALVIGSIVYAIGSLMTAFSPNMTVLFLGWSIIEGLGAVLVIPAIAALAGRQLRRPRPGDGVRGDRGGLWRRCCGRATHRRIHDHVLQLAVRVRR